MSVVENWDRRLSIAPMMGWTDRHARFFLRQISRHVMLFSEMLTPDALVKGRKEYYVGYDPQEHPVAFQVGGNDPTVLSQATRILADEGFDEVNLNVGCPSPNGQRNPYGAYLMKEPRLVAQCVRQMQDAVQIPVTVKTRIGIDRDDSYEPLADFVGTVRETGCSIFYIHARKAWLDGLSPKENREIPPLRYEYVYRLKKEFPDLTVLINGGITEWDDAKEHMKHVDGVMVGRRAYKDPYWLATVDRDFYGSQEPVPTRPEILRRCIPYVDAELRAGTGLRHFVRHIGSLYRDSRAATAFRRFLAIECNRAGGGKLDTFLRAIDIAEGLEIPRERRLTPVG